VSVQALTWVLDRSEAKLGARLILLAIANHADKYGEQCWASVRTLAEAARLSERQTRVNLRVLEDAGEIEEVGRHPKYGTHVYRLPKMAAQTLPVGEATAPAESAPGNRPSSGGQNHAGSVSETAPEPSSNPSQPSKKLIDAQFEQFWRIYPRRVGKRAARKAYGDALKRAPSPQAIFEGAQRYRDAPKPFADYSPAHPATWLNQDRWEDELDAGPDTRPDWQVWEEALGE
jgi:hypothetical protein